MPWIPQNLTCHWHKSTVYVTLPRDAVELAEFGSAVPNNTTQIEGLCGYDQAHFLTRNRLNQAHLLFDTEPYYTWKETLFFSLNFYDSPLSPLPTAVQAMTSAAFDERNMWIWVGPGEPGSTSCPNFCCFLSRNNSKTPEPVYVGSC